MSKRKVKPKFTEDFLPPQALNAKQSELINCIRDLEMTITVGPAGTGKTYIPSCYAGYFYKKGIVDKIIITRPNVPTGKSIGFFPGTLNEKMEPWTKPITDVLVDYLTAGAVETMIKSGNIEIVPFETIRGRSWSNAFIMLDEAQNTTVEEMKAFCTRIGENCRVVVNGDTTQSDLKERNNGLAFVTNVINNSNNLRDTVGLVTFTSQDIVRSGLCQMFVQAFEQFS